MAKTNIYRAKESFVTKVSGVRTNVKKGQTAHGDSELFKGREALFEPVEDRIDFDAAGEKRKRSIYKEG